MVKENNDTIILPALRGNIGDWVYYSCLMNFKEVCNRVSYPHEVHRSEKLSEMIQRQLEEGRAEQIATYIQTQKERFFNSLVVGSYGGEPKWYGLEEYSNNEISDNIMELIEDEVQSIGFLELTGKEKMFAVDGQHRLAGIEKAIKNDKEVGIENTIPIIFIKHERTKKGLKRTRRLFTTLNKNAKRVSKDGIIALDEDDVMAITVRWLIEEDGLFYGERVAYVASNNIPSTNLNCLITIGMLYDVLGDLFISYEKKENRKITKKRTLEKLKNNRPPEGEMKEYFEKTKHFFDLMQKNFTEIGEFFSSGEDFPEVVKKYRKIDGGSILFRTTGFKFFMSLIINLSMDTSLEDAMERIAKLPRDLNCEPYINSMWDGKRISPPPHIIRLVLLYMIGEHGSNESEINNLLEIYRIVTSNPDAKLPKRIV